MKKMLRTIYINIVCAVNRALGWLDGLIDVLKMIGISIKLSMNLAAIGCSRKRITELLETEFTEIEAYVQKEYETSDDKEKRKEFIKILKKCYINQNN